MIEILNKKILIYSLLSVGFLVNVKAAIKQFEPEDIPPQATEEFDKTRVLADLKVHINENVDKLHFVRNNNDPSVITKAYIIKNAELYEIRPYLRSIVNARRVIESDVGVECIEYNDGTKIVLIAAENYRFESSENGMGIDEIIKILDRPKITSSSGSAAYFYFPRYRRAQTLVDLVKKVGANMPNDSKELRDGSDIVIADEGINAAYLFIPYYSINSVSKMLNYYDRPLPMASIKYTIYEVFSENDGKLGADFQAWKNNDGLDLFSSGLRYRNNWSSNLSGEISPSGSNKTSFVNFNPKWNTRYLDFLVAKGKGAVVTSGTITVQNKKAAFIEDLVKINYQSVESDKTSEEKNVNEYTYTEYNNSNFSFIGNDSSNNLITVAGSGKAVVVALRNKINPDKYRYKVMLKNISGEVYFVKNNQKVDSREIYTLSYEPSGDWYDDISLKLSNSNNFSLLDKSFNYGFKMALTPVINRDSATVKIKLANDSLVGWNSNGEPRINRTSDIDTTIHLSKNKNRFVVGGVKKQSVVRSVTGVPYLRNLPLLGWLFSTESEATKSSQLIIVAECTDFTPATTTTLGDAGQALNTKSGNNNKYGFGQLLLDD